MRPFASRNRRYRSSRDVRSGRPSRRLQCLGLQPLEARELLTATLYIDFGDRFPTAGLTMTDQTLTSTLCGPDFQEYKDPQGTTHDKGVTPATNITFQPLSSLINFDFNGDHTVNATDITALRNAVVALVKHDYAPFNVDVELASASSVSDIKATLAANGSNKTGDNDAYVIVGSVSTDHGTIDTTTLGATSGIDVGNLDTHDKTSVVIANNILNPIYNYNRDVADTALASVVAHEAGHAFGLGHTDDISSTANSLLTGSDIMATTLPITVATGMGFFTEYPVPFDLSDPSFKGYRPALQALDAFDKLLEDPNIGANPTVRCT
jgi:hypothetical protein